MAAFNEHLRDFAGRLIVYRLYFYTHFGIQLCKSILAFGLFALIYGSVAVILLALTATARSRMKRRQNI